MNRRSSILTAFAAVLAWFGWKPARKANAICWLLADEEVERAVAKYKPVVFSRQIPGQLKAIEDCTDDEIRAEIARHQANDRKYGKHWLRAIVIKICEDQIKSRKP